MRRKLNDLQKIIVVIYLIILTTLCVFYLPFESGVFDSIWSENKNIDVIKLLILILVITVTSIISIKFADSFNNYSEEKRKIIIKREIKLFLLLIFINISFLLSFISINLYNKSLEFEIKNKIELTKTELYNIAVKKEIRRNFWNHCSPVFDMSEFDGYTFDERRNSFWNFMEKNKENEDWARYFISNLRKYTINYFEIKTPKEFIKFIENNSFSLTEEKLKSKVIFDNEKELGKVKYYTSSNFIQKNMTYVLFLSIAVLFLLRIFFIKIYKILKS